MRCSESETKMANPRNVRAIRTSLLAAVILCNCLVGELAYALTYTVEKLNPATSEEATKWKAIVGVPATSQVRVKVTVIPLMQTNLTVVRLEAACGDGLCPTLFRYTSKGRSFDFYLWCKERITVFTHPEKNGLGDKEDVNGIMVDADKFGIVITPTSRGPLIVPTLDKLKN